MERGHGDQDVLPISGVTSSRGIRRGEGGGAHVVEMAQGVQAAKGRQRVKKKKKELSYHTVSCT